jgi:hypothetical protein
MRTQWAGQLALAKLARRNCRMAEAMPRPSRAGRRLAEPGLDLPPGFSLVTLREAGDAHAHAQVIAEKSGAGTLVWVRRFDLIEFAVVLEPEEPLSQSRLVFYAAMNALADALAFHCPPERPLSFAWPDTILFDGGVLGGGRLAWPAGAGEADAPAWLVFGAMLRAAAVGAGEPGSWAQGVAMDEAGFDHVAAGDLIVSFAQHLMLNLDGWAPDRAPVEARRFVQRLPARAGLAHAIAVNGDLQVKQPGSTGCCDFRAALAVPSWLDADRGEPWL